MAVLRCLAYVVVVLLHLLAVSCSWVAAVLLPSPTWLIAALLTAMIVPVGQMLGGGCFLGRWEDSLRGRQHQEDRTTRVIARHCDERWVPFVSYLLLMAFALAFGFVTHWPF